ncbi:hypothetical protein NPX94_26750, partial [Bacillus wiedmannii]
DIKDNAGNLVAGIKFILPPQIGDLLSIEEQEIPAWITEYKITSKLKNIKSITSGDDRLGYIISVADSAEELISRNQSFIDKLHFKYRRQGEECVKN